MKSETKKLFFALIRSAIGENDLTASEKSVYSAEVLSEIWTLAKQHDLLNLAALGLKKSNLIGENSQQLDAQIYKAAYRCEQQAYELNRLVSAFESAQIPFIPLKGSVLRNYYPESWMRTSCDVDVLIHITDVEKAKSLLVNSCGYEYKHTSSHDLSFYSSNKTHLELHYDLLEDERVNNSSHFLKNVWEAANLSENSNFKYEMTDEMFYLYHIAHMAKHFMNGGCGIRPFIDLWILNHRVKFDSTKRSDLLEKSELSIFEKQVSLLSEIWFGNAEHTPISEKMEEYILTGGVYGCSDNRISVQQQKQGGRLKYAVSKIFIPYDVIKFYYPVLQKHRWLTPVMEVRRWGRIIFCGHAKRTYGELVYNNSISSDSAKNTKRFLQDIGLLTK